MHCGLTFVVFVNRKSVSFGSGGLNNGLNNGMNSDSGNESGEEESWRQFVNESDEACLYFTATNDFTVDTQHVVVNRKHLKVKV